MILKHLILILLFHVFLRIEILAQTKFEYNPKSDSSKVVQKNIKSNIDSLRFKDYSFKFEPYLGKKFPFPNFYTLGDSIIDFQSLLGKPTVITFWFTACKPCVDEIPVLNQIKSKSKDNVNFVAITFETEELINKFLIKHPFDFIHVCDAQTFLDQYGVDTFPINIFLDKEGYLRYTENGIPYRQNDKMQLVIDEGKEFAAIIQNLMK
jgi:cytochrome c biogenesis protein CcmG, thiol:disulfide interchange protein DsbE